MEKDHLEIILEDIRGKFDLVLEGHDGLRKEIQDTRQELCEKIKFVDFKLDTIHQSLDKKIDDVEDRLNQKIDNVEDRLNQKIDSVEDNLSKKIDAVATDLKEHRADTEVHKKVYKVKEE